MLHIWAYPLVPPLRLKLFGMWLRKGFSKDWLFGKAISIKRRIMFLKSTLCSLPIYFLSFIIPKSVAKRLEKIQRDFLWGGGSTDKKPHLVNWLEICKDKNRRGLGIKDLSTINKALLGKWCWRFTLERDML